MDEKLSGYILLALGIIIMVFSILQLGLLITRIIKPFPTFKFTQVFIALEEGKEAVQRQQGVTLTKEQQLLEQIQSKQAIISPDVVNEVLNFAVYFFFMAFLIQVGNRIATLGTNLLKPTTIKVHPRDIEDIARAAAVKDIANQPSPMADVKLSPAAKSAF